MPNAVSSAIIPAQQVSARGVGIRDAARTFYSELSRVMREYADPNPNASMTVMGITLVGDDRFGMVGSILLNEFTNQNANAMESVINQFSNLMKIEQELGKL